MSGRCSSRSLRWCKTNIRRNQIGISLLSLYFCSIRFLRIGARDTIASLTTFLRTTIFSTESFEVLPEKRRTLEVLLRWPIIPFRTLVEFFGAWTKAGVMPRSFELFNHGLRLPSLKILSVLLILIQQLLLLGETYFYHFRLFVSH